MFVSIVHLTHYQLIDGSKLKFAKKNKQKKKNQSYQSIRNRAQISCKKEEEEEEHAKMS
jgi:hypothetical protein